MNKIYDVQRTNKFKKSYVKIMKQKNYKKFKEEFEKVIEILRSNELLPLKYRNHLLEPKSKRYMGMSYITRHLNGIQEKW